MTAYEVALALAHTRFTYSCERDLHAGVEGALRRAGYDPTPEVRLVGGRVDFLVGGVAVEVKVKGGRDALLRQVTKYASDPVVDGVLVVTTKRAHRAVPSTVADKPLVVLVVGGLA